MKLAILFAVVFLAQAVQAETIKGRVVAITDGDTITVLDASNTQHKIRLAGIDAPEKKQPFGERSKQSLATLAFNKDVTVDWRKMHRKRLIGKVTVDGVDVSLEQVKAGMAWWYKKYRKEQPPDDQRKYEQAELNAQLQRNGLWGDKHAMPPWDWRKLNKEDKYELVGRAADKRISHQPIQQNSER